MSIAVGSDHAGFRLKEKLVAHLSEKNIEYFDFGTFDEKRVDYPDYAFKVARAVSSGEYQFGLVVCGSGIGVSITANKVKGIRAALCCSEYMAEMARRHNDANVLAMGGRTTAPEEAIKILDAFLKTGFEGGRHQKRIEKIHNVSGC